MPTTETIIPAVARWILQNRPSPGDRLPAQLIADDLDVSRTPITAALERLMADGVVTRTPGRGFAVAPGAADSLTAVMDRDEQPEAYRRIVDDLLAEHLPRSVTEAELGSRYNLTRAQTASVLALMAREGWATRRPGYGWNFSPTLTTPEALYDSYRFRLAFEPEAMLQPGYAPEVEGLLACREVEVTLLERGADSLTRQQLYTRGVRFHETVAAGCPNPLFVETLRRVNSLRRLLAYRSMQNRERYEQQAAQHLQIVDLILDGHFDAAAETMRTHLSDTLHNHERIRRVLDERTTDTVEDWSTT